MKKIIKTAIIAAMGALALGMMSCQKDNDDHEILKQTSWGSTASWLIDYTNESSTYNRGFNVLSTKHTSGKCTITIADSNAAGVAGFVFGKTNNGDGTANFGLVGIQRYNSTSIRYYVSWYKNVDLSKMDGFSNFVGTDKKLPGTSGATCEETDKTGSWKLVNNYTTAGANAVIKIEVEATGTGNPVTAANSDGGYKVTLKKTDGTAIDSPYTISSSDTGLSKSDQGALGAYANVYSGRYMYATIAMNDLVQELEVEE